MAEIGSCQVGGCVSQATAPFLLSASRVPSCVVATWMSRATTARGQLPLASSEKHHTLSVMSRSSRASAANHLSTFRPRCQGRRCASCVTTPRANRPNRRNRQWLLPCSVSCSRDSHPRCDAATGSYVPEGEKHDRDPTGAIHDGSPLAPLRDGGVDFPAVQKPKRP